MSEENIIPSTEPSIEPVQVSPQSILDMLSDDSLKSEASLSSFKDVNSLAKSYVNASKMLGSSIRLPSEDASEEQKSEFLNKLSGIKGILKLPTSGNKEETDAFYTALGRPDKPENYDIKIDQSIPPEAVDVQLLSSFKNLAHELGLNSTQTQSLIDFQTGLTAKQLDSAGAAMETSEKILKETWGQDYNNQLGNVSKMVDMFSRKYPEATKAFVAQNRDNPLIYMAFAELAQLYQERGHIPIGTMKQGLTPEIARDKMNDIKGNRKHAYFNASHPDHDAAVEEMSRLHRAAYPTPDNQS